MRDEMVFAALRCKRPKWVVLVGLLAGKRWTEEELFYGPDEVGGLRGGLWGGLESAGGRSWQEERPACGANLR